MFDQATKLAQSLDAIEQGYSSKQIGLALVEAGRTQAAEDLILSIDHAASRGDALGALGSTYAERGDVKTSRARFAAAFEAALKIDAPMGLDTVYSRGGAIRMLAHKQAIVDMPGLQEFLRAAKSPNIRAYGYLGVAEGLVPMAVERAGARGLEYPQGLFDEIWNQRATITITGSD